MPMSFQNSWTNSLQPGEYDANEDEKEANIQDQEEDGGAQAQAHSNQRITKSMARSLGRDFQIKSLFVISLVLNYK